MRRLSPLTLRRIIPISNARTIFSFLKPTQPQIIPLSQSPHLALREKAQRIKTISLCPTSFDRYGERLRPEYECPDCGFPTHATRERWEEGHEEHLEYCSRLKEVNLDEHDIRSGREMKEFENMPGEALVILLTLDVQPYEAAVSFTSWDNFFFTRNFPSIDTDRAVRQVSKVLTYPITIAGVLHQNGPFTSRISTQGKRSFAAIHSMLHLPPGSSAETAPIKPQPPMRIFLLGARAESTLPPALWQQFTYLFPRTNFNIYFIGPEVGLPLLDKFSRRKPTVTDDGAHLSLSPQLSLTSIKASYQDVHEQLGPFDPYTDVFFAFSPGLGFPDLNNGTQVQAQTSWKEPLQQILTTKCALFFTAFSPLDLQRDVAALFGTHPPTGREFPDHVKLPTEPVRIEGITDEFDLILEPGSNPFQSRKWEIAEWDVRVGVRTNWGIWGIRGKRYDVIDA